MSSTTRSSSSYFSTDDVRNNSSQARSRLNSTTGSATQTRTRTSTTRRPNTAATSATYLASQEIIVAISESRGVSPIVGLAILNLSSAEAVLCQICDTQTYVRTIHKLTVFSPSEILFATTAQSSKMHEAVEENLKLHDHEVIITNIDRKYWNEASGLDYITQLALSEDVESLKVSLCGNYYTASCFAAVMKYVELSLSKTFAYQSLRIKFEPSQGSAMIDLSTIASLELIQNLQNAKSKDCLLGLLNETLTPMGSRILKSNILQPSTDPEKLQARYDALEELTSKEEMFYGVRQHLKGFVDTDRVLSQLVLIPTKFDFLQVEQSINKVVQLKTFVDGIKPLWQALTGAESDEIRKIRSLCAPERYEDVRTLIEESLNADVSYSTQPLELRNQRTYAIKAGFNGFLDVARQTYKESNEDAFTLVNELNDTHNLSFDMKYELARKFYIQIPASSLEDRQLPDIFINVFRRKSHVECQTLDLMKINQKITDAHNEVINMSDATIQKLIEDVRKRIAPLFKISEAIALLDMLAAFGQLVTTQEYVKPELTETLAIKAGRHPILEKINKNYIFVPNDVYATQQSRFQIITGCNMSGKSTYIRSIALTTIMAQIGCFVPAQYASFPIIHQIFARVSTDDNVEANVSTFSAEMREMAFILGNIEPRSLVLIDELGRGTSTTDGLAIAIAIAEALISSGALVWFVTHFHELPHILELRAGVVNLHLAVDMDLGVVDHVADEAAAGDREPTPKRMRMLYKISDGPSMQQYYGLALARVINLPAPVIETAERVSRALNQTNEAKKQDKRMIAVAKRRKLVLSLKEQLEQARKGKMRGKELKEWLQKLQDEFAVRMAGIDVESRAVASEFDESANLLGDKGELAGSVYEEGADQGEQSPEGKSATVKPNTTHDSAVGEQDEDSEEKDSNIIDRGFDNDGTNATAIEQSTFGARVAQIKMEQDQDRT